MPEGVESVVGNERQHVIEFQDRDTTRPQDHPKTRSKIIRVAYMGEQVVVDDEVRRTAIRDHLIGGDEPERAGDHRPPVPGRGFRQWR